MSWEAVQWVEENMGYTIVDNERGQVREVKDYPLTAVRELLSNALVHRDLAPWWQARAIEMRLLPPGWLLAIQRVLRHHCERAGFGVFDQYPQWHISPAVPKPAAGPKRGAGD